MLLDIVDIVEVAIDVVFMFVFICSIAWASTYLNIK